MGHRNHGSPTHAPSTPAAVRKQIAAGKPDPLYLIVGDDEAEMSHLAADLSGIVEDELRAFNVERIYATDKILDRRRRSSKPRASCR